MCPGSLPCSVSFDFSPVLSWSVSAFKIMCFCNKNDDLLKPNISVWYLYFKTQKQYQVFPVERSFQRKPHSFEMKPCHCSLYFWSKSQHLPEHLFGRQRQGYPPSVIHGVNVICTVHITFICLYKEQGYPVLNPSVWTGNSIIIKI